MANNTIASLGWLDFWQLTPMNLAIWESLCTGEIRLYAKNQNFSLTNEVWPPFLIFFDFLEGKIAVFRGKNGRKWFFGHNF